MTQRFYVVKVDEVEPRHYFGTHPDEYASWSQGQEACDGDRYDRDTVLFGPGKDTRDHAERLAKFLAGKFPGNSYGVLDTQSVFFCEPGDVKQAKFTEKGFLPV